MAERTYDLITVDVPLDEYGNPDPLALNVVSHGLLNAASSADVALAVRDLAEQIIKDWEAWGDEVPDHTRTEASLAEGMTKVLEHPGGGWTIIAGVAASVD